MVRITVLYPNESAKRFDHDYYARKHMPMVMERLKGSGMLRYEVDKGLAGGGPETLAAAPRPRAERSTSAFSPIWRGIGSSTGQRCSNGCGASRRLRI